MIPDSLKWLGLLLDVLLLILIGNPLLFFLEGLNCFEEVGYLLNFAVQVTDLGYLKLVLLDHIQYACDLLLLGFNCLFHMPIIRIQKVAA